MKRINNLNIDSIEVKTLSELAIEKFKAKDLSIRLAADVHAKLKMIAYFNETSMSEIIRALVVKLSEQFDPDNVETIPDNPAPKTETF